MAPLMHQSPVRRHLSIVRDEMQTLGIYPFRLSRSSGQASTFVLSLREHPRYLLIKTVLLSALCRPEDVCLALFQVLARFFFSLILFFGLAPGGDLLSCWWADVSVERWLTRLQSSRINNRSCQSFIVIHWQNTGSCHNWFVQSKRELCPLLMRNKSFLETRFRI